MQASFQYIGIIHLTAFLSLLTKNTIFFETGSGCSSVIAKYYAKKTYAVEGCKKYYEIGIKNGLKDILLFNDLFYNFLQDNNIK